MSRGFTNEANFDAGYARVFFSFFSVFFYATGSPFKCSKDIHKQNDVTVAAGM